MTKGAALLLIRQYLYTRQPSPKEHVEKDPSRHSTPRRRQNRSRRGILILTSTCLLVVTAGAIWLGLKAVVLVAELRQMSSLVVQLKSQINEDQPEAALDTVAALREHASTSRAQVNDPVWTAGSALPWLGPNLQAAREMTIAADDIVQLGIVPLSRTYQTLDWQALMSEGGIQLQPLASAAPELAAASHAVQASSHRLHGIDESELIEQLRTPLRELRDQLEEAEGSLTVASDTAQVAPQMMGASDPRQYLLLIQNNAEIRATGGIPGALAVLELDNGKITLRHQSSAGSLGPVTPIISVDPEQQQIYSARLGKFMQDVNLTPDFPTAASTASAMWKVKTGQDLDGVLSIDPVGLSYILEGTGPVRIDDQEIGELTRGGLPTELNSQNVVSTLISDVYAKIRDPELQDVYFAAVAKEIFSALSDGQGEPQGLLNGLSRATAEGRVRVWSADASEQALISKYPLGGSAVGPSVEPAEFGVYFNDGTGAKMDYYVKRSVQLIRECPQDGYEQTKVRITSKNTAPADAAVSLPPYVTGAGNFGVPPGSVQTNVVAYGPALANAETANLDGNRTAFAPYFHGTRPVGVLAITLAPGESKTVEFTFGKIVQHSEPNLVVTPTVQPVNDVILVTEQADCG